MTDYDSVSTASPFLFSPSSSEIKTLPNFSIFTDEEYLDPRFKKSRQKYVARKIDAEIRYLLEMVDHLVEVMEAMKVGPERLDHYRYGVIKDELNYIYKLNLKYEQRGDEKLGLIQGEKFNQKLEDVEKEIQDIGISWMQHYRDTLQEIIYASQEVLRLQSELVKVSKKQKELADNINEFLNYALAQSRSVSNYLCERSSYLPSVTTNKEVVERIEVLRTRLNTPLPIIFGNCPRRLSEENLDKRCSPCFRKSSRKKERQILSIDGDRLRDYSDGHDGRGDQYGTEPTLGTMDDFSQKNVKGKDQDRISKLIACPKKGKDKEITGEESSELGVLRTVDDSSQKKDKAKARDRISKLSFWGKASGPKKEKDKEMPGEDSSKFDALRTMDDSSQKEARDRISKLGFWGKASGPKKEKDKDMPGEESSKFDALRTMDESSQKEAGDRISKPSAWGTDSGPKKEKDKDMSGEESSKSDASRTVDDSSQKEDKRIASDTISKLSAWSTASGPKKEKNGDMSGKRSSKKSHEKHQKLPAALDGTKRDLFSQVYREALKQKHRPSNEKQSLKSFDSEKRKIVRSTSESHLRSNLNDRQKKKDEMIPGERKQKKKWYTRVRSSKIGPQTTPDGPKEKSDKEKDKDLETSSWVTLEDYEKKKGKESVRKKNSRIRSWKAANTFKKNKQRRSGKGISRLGAIYRPESMSSKGSTEISSLKTVEDSSEKKRKTNDTKGTPQFSSWIYKKEKDKVVSGEESSKTEQEKYKKSAELRTDTLGKTTDEEEDLSFSVSKEKIASDTISKLTAWSTASGPKKEKNGDMSGKRSSKKSHEKHQKLPAALDGTKRDLFSQVYREALKQKHRPSNEKQIKSFDSEKRKIVRSTSESHLRSNLNDRQKKKDEMIPGERKQKKKWYTRARSSKMGPQTTPDGSKEKSDKKKNKDLETSSWVTLEDYEKKKGKESVRKKISRIRSWKAANTLKKNKQRRSGKGISKLGAIYRPESMTSKGSTEISSLKTVEDSKEKKRKTNDTKRPPQFSSWSYKKEKDKVVSGEGSLESGNLRQGDKSDKKKHKERMKELILKVDSSCTDIGYIKEDQVTEQSSAETDLSERVEDSSKKRVEKKHGERKKKKRGLEADHVSFEIEEPREELVSELDDDRKMERSKEETLSTFEGRDKGSSETDLSETVGDSSKKKVERKHRGRKKKKRGLEADHLSAEIGGTREEVISVLGDDGKTDDDSSQKKYKRKAGGRKRKKRDLEADHDSAEIGEPREELVSELDDDGIMERSNEETLSTFEGRDKGSSETDLSETVGDSSKKKVERKHRGRKKKKRGLEADHLSAEIGGTTEEVISVLGDDGKTDDDSSQKKYKRKAGGRKRKKRDLEGDHVSAEIGEPREQLISELDDDGLMERSKEETLSTFGGRDKGISGTDLSETVGDSSKKKVERKHRGRKKKKRGLEADHLSAEIGGTTEEVISVLGDDGKTDDDSSQKKYKRKAGGRKRKKRDLEGDHVSSEIGEPREQLVSELDDDGLMERSKEETVRTFEGRDKGSSETDLSETVGNSSKKKVERKHRGRKKKKRGLEADHVSAEVGGTREEVISVLGDDGKTDDDSSQKKYKRKAGGRKEKKRDLEAGHVPVDIVEPREEVISGLDDDGKREENKLDTLGITFNGKDKGSMESDFSEKVEDSSLKKEKRKAGGRKKRKGQLEGDDVSDELGGPTDGVTSGLGDDGKTVDDSRQKGKSGKAGRRKEKIRDLKVDNVLAAIGGPSEDVLSELGVDGQTVEDSSRKKDKGKAREKKQKKRDLDGDHVSAEIAEPREKVISELGDFGISKKSRLESLRRAFKGKDKGSSEHDLSEKVADSSQKKDKGIAGGRKKKKEDLDAGHVSAEIAEPREKVIAGLGDFGKSKKSRLESLRRAFKGKDKGSSEHDLSEKVIDSSRKKDKGKAGGWKKKKEDLDAGHVSAEIAEPKEEVIAGLGDFRKSKKSRLESLRRAFKGKDKGSSEHDLSEKVIDSSQKKDKGKGGGWKKKKADLDADHVSAEIAEPREKVIAGLGDFRKSKKSRLESLRRAFKGKDKGSSEHDLSEKVVDSSQKKDKGIAGGRKKKKRDLEGDHVSAEIAEPKEEAISGLGDFGKSKKSRLESLRRAFKGKDKVVDSGQKKGKGKTGGRKKKKGDLDAGAEMGDSSNEFQDKSKGVSFVDEISLVVAEESIIGESQVPSSSDISGISYDVEPTTRVPDSQPGVPGPSTDRRDNEGKPVLVKVKERRQRRGRSTRERRFKDSESRVRYIERHSRPEGSQSSQDTESENESNRPP